MQPGIGSNKQKQEMAIQSPTASASALTVKAEGAEKRQSVPIEPVDSVAAKPVRLEQAG